MEKGTAMNASEMLEKVGQLLGATASVKSVFGDPIHTEGKTVVPVARVAYGFGAGSGEGPPKLHPNGRNLGEGGGGGGGLTASAAGALEITKDHIRFVPFHSTGTLAGVFAIGVLCGLAFRRRRIKS
jgi:uncharacterized spore protein YtfJ